MNSRKVASLLLAGSISIGGALLPAPAESQSTENRSVSVAFAAATDAQSRTAARELSTELSDDTKVSFDNRSKLLAEANTETNASDVTISDTTESRTSDNTRSDGSSSRIAAVEESQTNTADGEKTASDEAVQKDEAPIAGQSLPPRVDLGLDSKTLKAANQGDWKTVAQKLEKLTEGKKAASKDRAWLAFTYMFLGRCDDLETMYHKLEASEPGIPAEGKGYFSIIKAFNQVCTGKLDEADATLSSLPRRHVNDAFVSFALAAVAGKRGKAGAASEYCKRSVALDPRFAWGWRTLGYLQLRWLNLTGDAENSFEKALAIEPNQSEVREMLINSYISHNDFDKAIDVAKAGIKTASQDANSYNRLAQIYLQQWRLREALTELESSIKVDPTNANYYRSRSSIKRYQGDVAGAVTDQEKAVELSKDKGFELIELASLQADAGQVDKAVTNLEKAIAIQPDNRTAHERLAAVFTQLRRWDDLLKEYKRIIELNPKDAKLRLQLAETLHTLASDDEAIIEFLAAADLDQANPEPVRRVGSLYVHQKNYPKAVEAYKKALSINANSVQTLVALGYCYAQTEEYLKAEAAFVTALALEQLTGQRPGDPNYEDILRSLASLLLVEGRYGDATSQFQTLYGVTAKSDKASGDNFLLSQARFLSTRSPEAAQKLIAAFKELPEENKPSARYMLVQTLLKGNQVELAKAELASLPDTDSADIDPRWMILQARSKRLSGDNDGALTIINSASEKAESQNDDKNILLAELLVEKARTLLAKGDLDAAATTADKALKTYDKVFASYLVLGEVGLKKKNFDQAAEFASKALSKNPYFTDAYLLAGDALMRLNKPKEALDHYKKATEIYPSLLRAHKSLLASYKALALTDEAKKEEEQIANMEKVQ